MKGSYLWFRSIGPFSHTLSISQHRPDQTEIAVIATLNAQLERCDVNGAKRNEHPSLS
jgi:hypothetical protein